VKDILVESPKRMIWDACAKALHWKGNKGFRERRDLVDFLYLRTIEEGWELGRGPGGREYNECRPSELTGPIRRTARGSGNGESIAFVQLSEIEGAESE
jgi:hypothetical protein